MQIPLRNNAPKGVKYYSLFDGMTFLYVAVKDNSRVQMTSPDGTWIEQTLRWFIANMDIDYIAPCKRREAVDANGNHETWD